MRNAIWIMAQCWIMLPLGRVLYSILVPMINICLHFERRSFWDGYWEHIEYTSHFFTNIRCLSEKIIVYNSETK